jgi:hypothetical protein
MPNFFTAKSPKRSKFTNFAAAILLFAGFASAAINVSTASNVEIADFIVSESKKVLQIPDTLNLNLDFQTAKDEHGRAGLLFFIGERRVSIKMDYSITLPEQQLKGTLPADTSWFTGYCGVLECQTQPMPAKQRIDVLKYLVSKLLTQLKGKFQAIFIEAKPVADTAAADTTAADTTTAVPVDTTEASNP